VLVLEAAEEAEAVEAVEEAETTEVVEAVEAAEEASDYIHQAHAITQEICKIALGLTINGDTGTITIASLTETIRLLTSHLTSRPTDSIQTGLCPIS
jgi:hypothetical protein